MPTYVSLINWTEPGIKNFRDTTKRAQDFTNLVEGSGGKVRELVWTVGEYDIVSVFEFPDDESAVAALLQLGSAGNVRTKTLRAFDAAEMDGIIKRRAAGTKRAGGTKKAAGTKKTAAGTKKASPRR